MVKEYGNFVLNLIQGLFSTNLLDPSASYLQHVVPFNLASVKYIDAATKP